MYLLCPFWGLRSMQAPANGPSKFKVEAWPVKSFSIPWALQTFTSSLFMATAQTQSEMASLNSLMLVQRALRRDNIFKQ